MNVSLDPQPAVKAYVSAFNRFRDLPGFDQREVLLSEAGVIIKTWAGRTKVVSGRDLNTRARIRALRKLGASQGGFPGAVTINAGIRGPEGWVWYQAGALQRGKGKLGANRGRFQLAGKMQENGRFVANWYHFTDKGWHDIQDTVIDAEIAINSELKKAEKSAGLARQSVIQIADDLGIDLNRVQGGGTLSGAGIAKARAAIASNGRAYKNGRGAQGGDDVRYYLELFTQLPYGGKLGMDQTLVGILKGRAKYIETSYAKGAFDSIQRVGRAFPNLVTTSGLPS